MKDLEEVVLLADFDDNSQKFASDVYNNIKEEIENGSFFPSFYKNKEKLENIRKSAYKSFYLRPSYIISRLREGDFSLLRQQIGLFLKYISRD